MRLIFGQEKLLKEILRQNYEKIIFINCDFSSLFFPIQAEIIKKIIINGNSRVSDETIKIYGEIEINKDIQERDLDKILKNLYSTNFFEDVKVNFANNVITINLKEYPFVNQLVILGEKSNNFKDQIKN